MRSRWGSIVALCLALALGHAERTRGQDVQTVSSYSELIEYTRDGGPSVVEQNVESLPPGWWQPLVPQTFDPDQGSVGISMDQILMATLEHSQQIKVFGDLPLIRETAITESQASFDWTKFVDARWDDTSEPIGNALTAGPGVRRFRDHHLIGSVGARKRTYSGGQFEVGQQIGFQDNNSQFFTPDPQGTARLAFSFTQPLLRGRGKAYNTSLILLAKLDRAAADDEFRRQLQAHLLEVARSYWALYLERATLYQRTNSYARGKQIYDLLALRQGIDVSSTQLASAAATLKSRAGDLSRAYAAVRNAESRLRSLVNAPALEGFELLPTDQPSSELFDVDLDSAVATSLQLRPEVAQALKQIKSASVRLCLSKNEVLPVLNLVTEAYLSGLEDRGSIGDALVRQFDTGEPSYAFGLQYELPRGNRAALARKQRRRLELRQLESQYRTTLQTIRLEVEVAVREVLTAQQELFTKSQAMEARRTQLESLTMRWRQLPGDDVSASLALENLLDAQDRLTIAEFEYLQAQLTHSLAYINLKKATGQLLQHQDVEVGEGCFLGLPKTIVTRTEMQVEPDIFTADDDRISEPPPVFVEELPEGWAELPAP